MEGTNVSHSDHLCRSEFNTNQYISQATLFQKNISQATGANAMQGTNSKDMIQGAEGAMGRGRIPAAVGESAEHAIAARVDGHSVRHLLSGLHLNHLPTTTERQISTGHSAPP